MRNKSLEDHLLSRMHAPLPLPWLIRLKIAQDAARGLAYLHEEMDFQVVGTVGYAAPEYVQTGRLTAKSDVWSFGVVLYELITGRRTLERNLPRSEQKLLEWVKPYISDSKKFHLIIDPRLEGQYCIKSAQKLASLANKCLMKNPKSRPKMSEVVEMLGNIISGTSTQDEGISQSMSESDDVKEETRVEVEAESTKQGHNYLKKVLDIREIMSLRNRSIGKLDWRNWTPGLVRTW
ncbi:putative receptor-like protein kinase [Gossypium australe]|uniref:Putative receptor-like protein kinase n=1 Tax=Gossypium australe TaxID=47621 RepID=A0A5B6X9Q1_9ROSI|nr:putative receptor-like protein kinase [Gossypium australe]